MADSQTFVIVGAGLAGAKAVQALRERGFDGRLVVIGDEHHLPYERPPLSKDFLAGAKTLADFTVQPAGWYADHNVELRLGTPAASIDPAARTVTLADGNTVGYDKLLLATGSRSRRLPLPGADATGVHHLRSIDDAVALDLLFKDAGSLAVIGAGWIGLEVTATARGRGLAVHVVEGAEVPLQRSLGSEIGEVFARLHREHDVDLRLGAGVAEISTADGAATGLRLADGSTITADAVLVAVGAQPNIELAEAAGLAIGEGGVLVDAALRSSDPNIFAVGDIANHDHPVLGRLRVEHWATALHQPAVAAANLLGHHEQYTRVPYFYTDQYEFGMEYRGHASGEHRVVLRGDTDALEFLAFWLDDSDRVLAGMNVNRWDDGADIAALIAADRPVDAAALADPSVPLGKL